MKILYLLTLAILITGIAQGQPPKKRSTQTFNSRATNAPGGNFLDKQWWLGLKAGANLSSVTIDKRYSAISPVNYPTVNTDKVYDEFNAIGSQVTLEVSFYYKGFSFSFQPAYRHSVFTYTNSFEWSDPENANNQLTLTYASEQKVDHVETPLIFKYDIIGNKLRPYVQLGIFYSFLINANKSVEVSGTDYASGGVNQFASDPVIIGAKDLFADNYWGLLGGVGANYNLGNVRLNLDIQYRKGMSLINATENRFGSDRLSGIGEAMDDIRLNNISLSVGCLFPMRYLASGFKTLDQR
ncbi:MAG: outer membrane beta-barrel protein [Cyclobacteriaceae bacterium]|nr:outer membrane beta-barrel protein [Cyclobacteriaceae bacterium]